MQNKPFGSAVVLGSGIAGLVSARILSDYFEHVTIIEKDPEPRSPGFRPGIPQGRHFHALIPGGLDIMAKLLPGLKEDLRAAGSLLPEPGQFYFYLPEGKSYVQGRYQPDIPRGPWVEPPYVQTRGLLEHCVRARVCALGNVETRYDTTVKQVISHQGDVVGVKVDQTGEEIRADLVIDALGRSGNTLRWLDAMGYRKPTENVVNCDFAYTSVFLRPNDPRLFTDVGFIVAPNPDKANGLRRVGALVRMEDGSWLTLLGGRYGDYPPRDFDEFMAWAETITEPRFAKLLRQTTPIGEPAHYRFPRGIRRRFDQLNDFPEGLLPIGDSVCHFNPAYGQGMTSASRQAIALQRALDAKASLGADLTGLWQLVFPQIHEETRAPWLFACIADFMHPDCEGDFPEEEMAALGSIQALGESAVAGDERAAELLYNIQVLKVPLSRLDDWQAEARETVAG